MNKKPTAAMKRNLDRLVENITTGDDSEDYQRERGYLDEYIRQGTTPFTHRWYDDFLEKDCEVSYTATQVIYDLRMELCIPLAEFLQAPSESLFRAMMAKAYFAQDLNGLKAVIDKKLHNACDMTPEERADLIDNRNRAWIEKIPTIMQAKSTLFAVGAGHLVGDNGLLKLLQDKGYTVEAVKN